MTKGDDAKWKQSDITKWCYKLMKQSEDTKWSPRVMTQSNDTN